jgi:3-hydroxyacyl-CoA dehydrogenase/enoyl-CoA hydratase/3-hydroxybutyryl-CoA epimerase
VAIDLSQKILNATVKDLGADAIDSRHVDLVNTMVDQHGRHGRKNGKGFYEYPDKPAKKHLWPGLKDMFEQKDPSTIDPEVLKQRFLVTQAVEAARTIEEGVVTDVREADVGSILGFGFAPYTGGTLSYIDGMGVAKFVELAEQLAKDYGDHFKPCALLIEMAEKGETFYGRFDPYGKTSKAA